MNGGMGAVWGCGGCTLAASLDRYRNYPALEDSSPKPFSLSPTQVYQVVSLKVSGYQNQPVEKLILIRDTWLDTGHE